ncbi:MAG: hypothetical protein KatS3mg073_1184 [Meiothermus sp.]|nr:MAG: hypothetical protein KatS3mg073_1184 [Meiothermus sp.]
MHCWPFWPSRAAWLELEPLSELEVAELIAHLSGRPARLFPQRVYRATSGNPLFVLETLRSLFESGELRLGEGGVWETPYDESTHDYTELPIAPSVRQAILGRLEHQGAAVRRSLEVAALVGEETFGSHLLAQASALSDWEVCEALEQACQHQLLKSTPQGYRFTHDLIARTIAETLQPDHRKLISARLAQHFAQQVEHLRGQTALRRARAGAAPRAGHIPVTLAGGLKAWAVILEVRNATTKTLEAWNAGFKDLSSLTLAFADGATVRNDSGALGRDYNDKIYNAAIPQGAAVTAQLNFPQSRTDPPTKLLIEMDTNNIKQKYNLTFNTPNPSLRFKLDCSR